ncbi:hypothetical protein [Actinoplanes palleronii]|uniref:Uncharacterized protein n=1 Tax=Actinoplanes palleronii TaxID=113570 RepID=A0ABQ4B5I9_9ACTN|nr:hypothetical protein [Actinoplanes palleronii]GIE65924.1 hypothetical protein Apa02nite_020320 [Actinoplanes palleronii]
MSVARTILLTVAIAATVAIAGCDPDQNVSAPPNAGESAAPSVEASTAAASPAPVQAPVQTPIAAPATKTTAATPRRTTKTTAAKPADGRLGEIIHTGLDATAVSEWVIYGVPASGGSTAFAFRLSELQNNGILARTVDITETTGSPLAAGFHALEPASELEGGRKTPAFGYFAGTPATIFGIAGSKKVAARTAPWSANTSVTVFWFDNTQVTPDTALTGVTALDVNGKTIAVAR